MSATVIIGFGEALSAPEVAWSLVDNGFQVVAFCRAGRRSALRYSRLIRIFEVTAPEIDISRSLHDLNDLILLLGKDSTAPLALMPLDDQALWLCGRANFGGLAALVGPKGKALHLALDKRNQVQLAQEAGFLVPPFRCIDHSDEVSKEKVLFPVVFKPSLAAEENEGALSRGSGWICADQAELDSALGKWGERGPMMLQQFVAGVGEGIFGLATETGVLAWSGHRRIRMMNPQGSGSSACTVVSPISDEIKACAERFLQASGWRGLFMIEMLRDASGKPWFVEFNGRVWGSMALARRIGFEYPAWAVQKTLNPNAPLELPRQIQYTPVCRHFAREILYLLFIMRGSKSKALTEWPSIRTALSQVCRIGRNDRLYNWRSSDLSVFFGDCFVTLWSQLVPTKKH